VKLFARMKLFDPVMSLVVSGKLLFVGFQNGSVQVVDIPVRVILFTCCVCLKYCWLYSHADEETFTRVTEVS